MSGIAGSYRSSIFRFLRSLHTVYNRHCVAGRQGRGREILSDNERGNKEKTDLENVTWNETREGSLAPELKRPMI
jgi:hypothetical protein